MGERIRFIYPTLLLVALNIGLILSVFCVVRLAPGYKEGRIGTGNVLHIFFEMSFACLMFIPLLSNGGHGTAMPRPVELKRLIVDLIPGVIGAAWLAFRIPKNFPFLIPAANEENQDVLDRILSVVFSKDGVYKLSLISIVPIVMIIRFIPM